MRILRLFCSKGGSAALSGDANEYAAPPAGSAYVEGRALSRP